MIIEFKQSRSIIANLLNLKLGYIGFGNNVRYWKHLVIGWLRILFCSIRRKVRIRPLECWDPMLLVFDFFLLQMDSLLVLVQNDRHYYLMSCQKIDDFSKMTAHKGPFLFSQQLLSNFGLIAEYDYFGFALSLLQKAINQIPLAKVANDKRRTVKHLFGIWVEIIIASIVYVILLQLCLDILKFWAIMVSIDDVDCFAHSSFNQVPSLYFSYNFS